MEHLSKDENLNNVTQGTCQNSPIDTEMLYESAKTYFRRSCDEQIAIFCGRVQEQEAIDNFWKRTVESKQAGSLYLSGLPGTGKSALIQMMLQRFSERKKWNGKIIYVNCAGLMSPKDIFLEILKHILGSKITEVSSKKSKRDALFEYIERKKATSLFVFVLDEIDALMKSNQEMVMDFMKLASNSIALIGISNILNVTNKLIHNLKENDIKLPELIQFCPYSVDQVSDIIKARLNFVNTELKMCLFEESAIEFCARKVVASGDLRKALDIIWYLRLNMYRLSYSCALDVAQTEHRTLKDKNCLINITHVVKAVQKSIKSPFIKLLQENLNFHQKLLLCCLHNLRENSKVTIKQLLEFYFTTCQKSKIVSSLTRTEVIDLLPGLEDLGMIQTVTARNSKRATTNSDDMNKILSINVSSSDLFEAINDSIILKNIVNSHSHK